MWSWYSVSTTNTRGSFPVSLAEDTPERRGLELQLATAPGLQQLRHLVRRQHRQQRERGLEERILRGRHGQQVGEPVVISTRPASVRP